MFYKIKKILSKKILRNNKNMKLKIKKWKINNIKLKIFLIDIIKIIWLTSKLLIIFLVFKLISGQNKYKKIKMKILK